ncbi:MAG: hypothetical protein ACJAZ3_000561 [Sphingobacteriales bacterium]|jgi:hypothetical protein
MLAVPVEVKVTKVEFSTQITLENVERVITRNAQLLDGKEGYWHVQYEDRILVLIADEATNRLRIMSGILEEKDLAN